VRFRKSVFSTIRFGARSNRDAASFARSMRALVGGADCARAGVAVVLGGFARDRAWRDVARDDDGARSSRAVVDDDFDDDDARATATATPTLGAARDGDDAFVALNARVDRADAARVALDAIDALDALAGDDALDEACFVVAVRDDALERDAREVDDAEAFLAFEDARNGARASRAEGIVARALGARGLDARDGGALATTLRALEARGTKTRVLYAPAHEAGRFDADGGRAAMAVRHRLGRAVEASAFATARAYDEDAAARLTPAAAANERESLYV
jgi:hypothetical protein